MMPIAHLPTESSSQVVSAPRKRRRHPDLSQVKELVDYMRDMKVESFETPYLKVKFSPDAFAGALQPPATPTAHYATASSDFDATASDDEVQVGMRARR